MHRRPPRSHWARRCWDWDRGCSWFLLVWVNCKGGARFGVAMPQPDQDAAMERSVSGLPVNPGLGSVRAEESGAHRVAQVRGQLGVRIDYAVDGQLDPHPDGLAEPLIGVAGTPGPTAQPECCRQLSCE